MSNYSQTLDRATCRCCTWHNHLFLLTATVLIQTHWWGEFWQFHAVHGTGLHGLRSYAYWGYHRPDIPSMSWF